jgi:hypothetical protein
MTLSKILVVAVLPFLAVASDLWASESDDLDESIRNRARQTFLSLPLHFEENTGHFAKQVKYLARGPGYTLFLTPNETVLTMAKGVSSKQSVVRVSLVDANHATTLQGESKLVAPTNYLIGNDPKKWRTAANYEQVRCESVYPGIDLLYHGKQRQLEYDFEVTPGANPKQIGLRYDGVRRLRVDSDGSLVLKLKNCGELRQDKPVAYQIIDGERREIASRYVVKGKKQVVFRLADYDASQRLVIDPPVLSYSTYLGGTNADTGYGIAVDANGNAYVTGETFSFNFPTLNQYQTDQPLTDAFVAKINTNASGAASLLYSTYLGGSGGLERGNGIAVDSAGSAFVTGVTTSTDFPMVNQYQGDQPGNDAFVAKLNTNASGAASLVYSTYLGGNGNDPATAIAIDPSGNAYVTGDTDSTDFPTLNQYQTNQTGTDIFVTKLNPNASGAASLLYSTYLGGNVGGTGAITGADHGNGIAVDSNGIAYVTGWSVSTDFPMLNQYQTDQLIADAVVAKINTNASGAASLLCSTYLGGNAADIGTSIAVDSSGRAYVAGYTVSTDFPLLNEYQTDQPTQDAFVTKLNTNASGAASLLYSTYLGGNDLEYGNGIAVDSLGNAFITGRTASTDFPTKDPLQTDQADEDVFVSKINTNASGTGSLVFSTYLSGNNSEGGNAIAFDSVAVYVTGETFSTDFPMLNQYQTDQTNSDCFVTKFSGGASNETCGGAIAVALDEVVKGTTVGGINDYQLSGAACFTGIGQTASTAPGRDVVYSFTAPAADSYSFRVSNYSSGGNPVLYVASDCPTATGTPVTVTTCLGAANRTSASGAFTSEEVECLALTAGQQVFIFVDEATFSAGSTFVLEVNKCPSETETNNTPALADVPYFGVEGSIIPSTDVDFYILGTPPAGSRVFALVDGRAANTTDFDLRLTTTTDTLEYDDANADGPFGALSPTVAGTPLTGVSSYLRVNILGASAASQPYRLYAVVQPPSPSATAESEPNDTIAQADSAVNNYFSGSLAGPAPSTDIDLYSFTAEAGELIFLSLDSDPLRNDTPINAKLALLDANGATLLQVNDSGATSNPTPTPGSLIGTTPVSPAESLVFRATVSGTYYASVVIGTASAGATGAGDYLLSIAKGFQLNSVVSRKTHGATPFDIPLPITGAPGVECRSGGGSGDHTLVFTFNNNVVSGSPVFSGGVGSISGSPIFAGNTMTLNLTGVLDQQKITITLVGIKDYLSQTLPNTEVSMNVLLGDTTANKFVNSSDISQTKARSGQAISAANFRSDTTLNGTINASDVAQVKANSGHAVSGADGIQRSELKVNPKTSRE